MYVSRICNHTYIPVCTSTQVSMRTCRLMGFENEGSQRSGPLCCPCNLSNIKPYQQTREDVCFEAPLPCSRGPLAPRCPDLLVLVPWSSGGPLVPYLWPCGLQSSKMPCMMPLQTCCVLKGTAGEVLSNHAFAVLVHAEMHSRQVLAESRNYGRGVHPHAPFFIYSNPFPP